MAFVWVILGLVALALWMASWRPTPRRSQLRTGQSGPNRRSLSADRQQYGVPDDLLADLYGLTRNERAAWRLIESVAQANPDRDGRWIAEKVIRDIERDRR